MLFHSSFVNLLLSQFFRGSVLMSSHQPSLLVSVGKSYCVAEQHDVAAIHEPYTKYYIIWHQRDATRQNTITFYDCASDKMNGAHFSHLTRSDLKRLLVADDTGTFACILPAVATIPNTIFRIFASGTKLRTVFSGQRVCGVVLHHNYTTYTYGVRTECAHTFSVFNTDAFFAEKYGVLDAQLSTWNTHTQIQVG